MTFYYRLPGLRNENNLTFSENIWGWKIYHLGVSYFCWSLEHLEVDSREKRETSAIYFFVANGTSHAWQNWQAKSTDKSQCMYLLATYEGLNLIKGNMEFSNIFCSPDPGPSKAVRSNYNPFSGRFTAPVPSHPTQGHSSSGQRDPVPANS